MKESEFKFVIEWPKRAVNNDVRFQVFHIYADFKHYAYSVAIKPEKDMSDQDQRRLAISELKLRLIQDIANAEFKLLDSKGESGK